MNIFFSKILKNVSNFHEILANCCYEESTIFTPKYAHLSTEKNVILFITKLHSHLKSTPSKQTKNVSHESGQSLGPR